MTQRWTVVRVGSEESFRQSGVLMVGCGDAHTMAVMEGRLRWERKCEWWGRVGAAGAGLLRFLPGVPCVRQRAFEVIEVIDRILYFTVPPHQIGRLWRHQGLRITAQLGEDRESPGACMAHYPTDHRRGVSAGKAGAGGTCDRGRQTPGGSKQQRACHHVTEGTD
jgi:hypothetical protein